jgi:peptide subunit release factor 1 (eRF1)
VATDPVQRIRSFAHETPLALDLRTTLARLAALPPSTEAPYLTLSLDWQPEGGEPGRLPPPGQKRSERRTQGEATGAPRRPAWEAAQRELDELVARHGPRGAAFESLSADVARIKEYLASGLDPAAKGVIVVACHHRNVFEPVPLDVPVVTEFRTGAIPSLRQLVHAAEDFPPYAVLVAEQRDAFLWLLERQTWESSVQLESSLYPRKQKQGGWSQRRYQDRADERVDAFARTIAAEARQLFEDGQKQADYLIIAADEPMYSALNAEFHEIVKRHIISRVHLEMEANVTQIAAVTEPLVDEAERRAELEAVQAVRNGVAAGTNGVAGVQDTLAALEIGQVMTLVMNDDFTRAGWADYTLSLYGAGDPPREHPAGGDVANLTPTALEDEIVRLALRTDATVELVKSGMPITDEERDQIPDAEDAPPRTEAALALDALGGVGAILRYTIEET